MKQKLVADRSFLIVWLLSAVTCGFYMWYLVHCMAKETNIVCEGDGRKTAELPMFILLSIVTCGIYSIVWYYSWLERCNAYLVKNNELEILSPTMYLLIVLLLGALTCGIMYIVMYVKIINTQNKVNAIYNNSIA